MSWFPGLTIEQMEQDAILAALKFYRGNRTHAADALGMPIRTLTSRISKYKGQGIAIPEPATREPQAASA